VHIAGKCRCTAQAARGAPWPDRGDDAVEVARVAEACDEADKMTAIVHHAAQEDALAGEDARVLQADLRCRLCNGRIRLCEVRA